MSGGVDSTACALLLQKQGEVEGFFMRLHQPDFEKQKERVKSIAEKLSIKLNIIDLRNEFEEKVLDYFTSHYFKGLTPNPCVVCNREIKFGLFFDRMMGHGMDMAATGHYANLVCIDGIYHLYCGTDRSKDQSYFLSRLDQRQLSRVIFPLGGMEKEQTYRLVEEHGFDDFRGIESQDVCFLEGGKISCFLEKRAPGNFTMVQSLPAREKSSVNTGAFSATQSASEKDLVSPAATPFMSPHLTQPRAVLS
ncbi:hypothetical protein DGMP_07970 [Desulfomarina profundi]|uniref:Uncharacterized protein n=2 Tax=Desulfomarina profundi TaxID=2772557 RepID=A0A8D5FKX6_9BACT|nr:hypothetical protein DGMP_07970 [Desulfomarina profundi]